MEYDPRSWKQRYGFTQQKFKQWQRHKEWPEEFSERPLEETARQIFAWAIEQRLITGEVADPLTELLLELKKDARHRRRQIASFEDKLMSGDLGVRPVMNQTQKAADAERADFYEKALDTHEKRLRILDRYIAALEHVGPTAKPNGGFDQKRLAALLVTEKAYMRIVQEVSTLERARTSIGLGSPGQTPAPAKYRAPKR